MIDQRLRDPRELRQEAARLQATANAIEDGTWGALVDGRRTAAEIAEAVGGSPQAANNRLKHLYELGLLDRVRAPLPGGGRSFVYTIAITEADS